ncbi:MAG: N-acetylmuramoyl-L-alanine amidase [Gemmatimonadota bacterium]|nr:MAG: N-acetylmuramoyl-L-alanine amidase [Gemmatimonadota bacterium]
MERAVAGAKQMRSGAALLLTAVACAGCAAHAPELIGPPPIPPRSGPLAIDVVYPADSSFISARDSNFIFGSVGDGNAQLTINGERVHVEPNGAFIAWLPVPASPEDTLARYELSATLGSQRAHSVRTVFLPRPLVPLPRDSAVIDTRSVVPGGAWWVQEGEIVPVRVRASPGAQVRLLLPDGETISLVELSSVEGSSAAANWAFGRVPTAAAATPGTGIYEGELAARAPLGRGMSSPDIPPGPAGLSDLTHYCAPPPDTMAVGDSLTAITDSTGLPLIERPAEAAGVPTGEEEALAEAELPAECALLEVIVADDTARSPLPLDLWVLGGRGPVVELREEPAGTGRDGFVIGRAGPGATTYWQWTDGVRGRVSGRRNETVRITLDGQTEAWVAADEVVWLSGASLPERARVGTVRFTGAPDRLRVNVSIAEPVPYKVEVDGQRLTLTLYGAYSNTNWLQYGPHEPFLEAARWEQVASDRYLLHIDLRRQPWGYRARYRRDALSLEIRKPPSIDPERPLAGRTVVVDPGHPPAGATGPTRLYEGEANLAIAFKLKRLLEEEGAYVILTRADRSVVRLYDRIDVADLLDAEILVSIHNNALPDGVNPLERHGTSVYYFHRHSLDLARATQENLLKTMGLRDLGFGRASLALVRPTWMLAALTEGAFMMIPDQEAGLRSPAWQEAYARGVLLGMREFLAAAAGR